MSRKKALLASSLTVASTSLAMSSNQDTVVHADQLQNTQPHLEETDVNKSLYQFLKPVSLRLAGGTAEALKRVDPKPLVYQVKKGDTLYRIGLYYGVHYETLANYNQLADPDVLPAGQQLKIPIQPKWITSSGNETVEQVARKYHSTTILITDLNPFFRKQSRTEEKQWVLIPEKIQTEMIQQKTKQPKQRETKRHKVLKLAESTKPKQTAARDFQWPVKGQITSKFGWRNGRPHKGIDIWSAAKSQARIYASRGGIVTRSGYTNGYGNLVVIDHGNGWVSYYAHLSRISLGKGQRVESGEVVGNMGKTGNATGYHLHFEIRKNGEAINPLSILP